LCCYGWIKGFFTEYVPILVTGNLAQTQPAPEKPIESDQKEEIEDKEGSEIE
jgi:hypothetical protein